jgi:hypothetical protein
MGQKFAYIKTDENLRARKEIICAVAWVDYTGKWNKVVELVDALLEFWKVAPLPVVERKPRYILDGQELSVWGILAEATAEVGTVFRHMQKYQELFPAWSKPIWLTEFRRSNQPKQITAKDKQLAQVTIELQETKLQLNQAQESAGYNLQEALSKWFKFTPKGMSADRKSKIESAVRMYMTDDEKHSLAKIWQIGGLRGVIA